MALNSRLFGGAGLPQRLLAKRLLQLETWCRPGKRLKRPTSHLSWSFRFRYESVFLFSTIPSCANDDDQI
jgi:hypothetical protein